MKKMIIVILCLMLVLALLSVSPDKFNVSDIIGNDNDETSSTTSADVTTAEPVFVTESLFYYHIGAERRSTRDISTVPDNTRGYFVTNNVAYFCVKTSGSNSMSTNLELDMLVYNPGVYNYCCYYTTDMVSLTEYPDGQMIFDNPALVVYASMQNWSDLKAAHFDLVNNQSVNLGFYDPIAPEIPGA